MTLLEKLKIAEEAWTNPIPRPSFGDKDDVAVNLRGFYCYGLCKTFEVLAIPDKAALSRLLNVSSRFDDFFWPTTLEGAKDRVKFIREWIKDLEEKQ